MKSTTLTRTILVFLLTAIFTASAILMIGPQIMVIVPLAVLAGAVFAVRRSFLSLACFGYPLTFGFVSAWIGAAEIDSYIGSTGFAVSIGIGALGVLLIAIGFSKALAARTKSIAAGGTA